MEKFHAFAVTEAGVKHADGISQDASDFVNDSDYAIIIVADGHGSSKCFRSDIGARLLVDITKNSIIQVIQKEPKIFPIDTETDDGSESKFTLIEMWKEIINKWFNAAIKHEKENPIENDPKFAKLSTKYQDKYRCEQDYRCHAYGTTLIAVVKSTNYWYGFQIGDGKCAVLYEDGCWDLPIPPDDNCNFNITTSICDDNSLSKFRCFFCYHNAEGSLNEYRFGVGGQNKDAIKRNSNAPLAVFIGSDGVEDTYPSVDNDRYLTYFYKKRVLSIAEKGFELAKEEIKEFARQFAQHGSTDDVSIACIIGDFEGKSALIQQIKKETGIHEATEEANTKRRDATEKKITLDALYKANQSIIKKIENLNKSLESLKSERDKLKQEETNLNTIITDNEKDDQQYKLLRQKIRNSQNNPTADPSIEKSFISEINTFEKSLKEAEIKKEKCVEDYNKAKLKYDTHQNLYKNNPNNEKYKEAYLKSKDKFEEAEQNLIASTEDIEGIRKMIEKRKANLTEYQSKIESDIDLSSIKNEMNTLFAKINDKNKDISMIQDRIKDIQIQIQFKDTEIVRIENELDTLKENSKVPLERYKSFKLSWENAEKDAQEAEEVLRNIMT